MNRFVARIFACLINKRSLTAITILALLTIGLFSSSLRPTAGAPQQSSLSLDGAKTGACPNTTSSCTVSLTTLNGNDIVIAFAAEVLDLQTSCTFALSDSAGLSWVARSSILFDSTGRSQLQEFWAVSQAPLSSDIITESISGCGNNYNAVMAFGVTGANLKSPFDPNTSLPGQAAGTSANSSVTISTSNPNDMIIAGLSHGNNCCPVTPGPGFTMATQGDIHHAEYRVVNSAVTNYPVTFTDSVSDGWISIADAVQAGTGTSSSISIDGSSIQGCSHSTNSCVTSLSTSHPNDTIIVYTFETLDLQTSCTFSVSDTAGLSWYLRTQVSGRNDGSTSGNRDQMGEFWAHSSNPLVSDSINESISGCAGLYGGEYNGLTAVGITGASQNNPFDSNASVPGTLSGYSNTPSALISTSSPGDLIIGSGLQSSYQITAGPGFAPLQSGWLFSVLEFKQTSSTVTNLPVTFGDNTTWYWEIITDAVRPASFTLPPPGFTINTNSLITVTAGNDATAFVTVSGIGNFTGTVNLVATILPAGANSPILRLNSSQVNVPVGSFGSTLLAVMTSLNTTAGGYNFTISGSAVFGGKTLQQTFVGNIIVQAPPQPDFILNAYPTILTVFAGSSTTSTINVYPAQFITNSFTVVLSAQLPAVQGLTASLNPTAVTLSPSSTTGFSTLTINTLSTTSVGNYTFILTGKSGTISHTILYSLQVRPPPTLTLTPTSGPVGTQVVARGAGFLPLYGTTEILVTFDDQLVGFTFTSTGSFNFTFNVPVAQSGAHSVKATESLFIGTSTLLTATAPFQVTTPATLSTTLTVGTIYFPGDKAVGMIQVTSGGVPVSSTALKLTVTLTRPDNTKVVLNVTSLGSGLYQTYYNVPKTGLIGTYSIQAVAHLSGSTDGSALGSFEVKLPWLSSSTSAAITTGGIASVGALGVALVSWRMGYFRRPKKTI